MSELSDYRTPTPPGRALEPVIVLSETISRQTFRGWTIDNQRDYAQDHLRQQIDRREVVGPANDAAPQQLEKDESEVRSTLAQDAVPTEHLPAPNDSSSREGPMSDLPESPPNLFQNTFEQLDDHHDDLRTRIHQTTLEANALFKTEEAKLQEILTVVRNIMGPPVAKWIDENIAASMEAGKLVCGDLSVLDGQFNRPDNDEDDPSKSKTGGEHDEGTGFPDGDRKGKGKQKDGDESHSSDNSIDKGGSGNNTKVSGPPTRSNQRKRSAESLSDEGTGHRKRSNISPTVSLSPPSVPSLVSEKPSSPLKRALREVDDSSEDEVEKSITMHRSFSSILEHLSPVSKKARYQGSGTAASPLPGDSSTTKSHGVAGTTSDHVGPSNCSHPGTSRLCAPPGFPPVRPPAPPKRPRELTVKPLKRDTMRVRVNPDTGEFEVFDYEATQEYRERLLQDRFNPLLRPTTCNSEADFQTISELGGPYFKFDLDAYRSFEDHTFMS